MNIKLSANYSAILVLTLLLIAAALTQYGMRMQQQIFDKERYQRVLYAFGIELLQSSDELTTMARRYVVSRDELYKQYYLEILAIRNGEQVRPEHYNATYWKLEAGRS